MKYIALICVFVAGRYYLFGQPPSVDDIKSKIASASHDSVRAENYYLLSRIAGTKDINQAKVYADSGYFFYRRIGHEAGMQQRNYIEATFAYSQGNYPVALDNGLKYNDWAVRSGNIEREWYAASMLAMCYRETGDYTKGIQASLRGIDIGLQLNRDDENGFFYNELGNLYSTLKQWDEAYTYLKKSYDLAVSTKFPQGQSVSLRNLAANAIERKQLDEAHHYIVQSIAIDSAGGYLQGLSRSYQSLARLNELTTPPEKAIASWRKSMSYLNSASDPYDFAVIYQGLARNYLIKNNLDSVEKYIQYSNLKANTLKAVDFISEQKRIEAAMYEKKGDYKRAFVTLQSYIEKNTEQLNADIAHQITGLNVRYETSRKENEIALLTSEKTLNAAKLKSARILILFAVSGLLIFSLLSYYIYRLWSRTKTQNAVIAKSLLEKETLIQEIHHRVKNNLQFISSLLNLQARTVEDEVALTALKESQDRVRSMALIHQNLYQQEDFSAINSKTYFELLIQNLFKSYNISPERIKLVTRIESLQVDVDTMIPLGLVMNELISNALKHAFTDQAQGAIEVNLTEEAGALMLKVSDDGKGLNSQISSNSLGFRLINAFKSQLQADLEIKNDHGTTVVFKINNFKKAS
jgi:two-component sensor histidine kinase